MQPPPSPQIRKRQMGAAAAVIVTLIIIGHDNRPPMPEDAASAYNKVAPATAPAPIPAVTLQKPERAPVRRPIALGGYLKEVGDLSEDIQLYLGKFSEQNKRVADDLSLLSSDEWKINQAGNVAMLRLDAGKVLKMKNIPRRARHAQSILLKMAREVNQGMDTYVASIDQADVDGLHSVARHLDRVTALALQAAPEIAGLHNP